MNLSGNLINRILTHQNAVELANKLESVVSGSFKKSGSFDDLLNATFDELTVRDLKEMLSDKNNQNEDLVNSIKEIKSAIETLPNLKLTVAVTPTTNMVKKLSSLIRQSVNPTMTLEFDVDKKIIGGAIIVSNGNVFDFSLKKKITDYFTKKSDSLKKKIHHS